MLSTRGRKDVDAKDVKVKVIVEAFDILYLNDNVSHPVFLAARFPSPPFRCQYGNSPGDGSNVCRKT